jgi:DNA-binding LacI/PurR family transcriptional regulator
MGLTTVNQSLYQTGVEGVNALLKLIEENVAVASYTLPVSMVIRNTTAPPPPRD